MENLIDLPSTKIRKIKNIHSLNQSDNCLKFKNYKK